MSAFRARRGSTEARYNSFRDVVQRPTFLLWWGLALAIWVVPGGNVSLVRDFKARADKLGQTCYVCWKAATHSEQYTEYVNGGRGDTRTYYFCDEHWGSKELPHSYKNNPLVLAYLIGGGLAILFLMETYSLLKGKAGITVATYITIPLSGSVVVWLVLLFGRPPTA
jgi:hypothetical protein